MECATNARLTVSPIEAKGTARLLNLGCGQTYHPSWTNLDIRPADPSIRCWDVTQRLPFEDASFDAVYHSHLLEHLPRADALPFLRECWRVVKPRGVLRLAIPNLEAIARLYLHALDDAWFGDKEAIAHHRWLVMELYDQTTREQSGGSMIAHLQQEPCELAWYRLGMDGVIIRKHLQSISQAPGQPSLHLFGRMRERLLRWLLGPEYPLLQIGRFRRAGEVHHWMYDRVSLRALLKDAGFTYFRCVGPMESAIPGWNAYHLDTTHAGDVCKPDSLFVEADAP
jgi:predicted SAM-dependent methyltransferase